MAITANSTTLSWDISDMGYLGHEHGDFSGFFLNPGMAIEFFWANWQREPETQGTRFSDQLDLGIGTAPPPP